MSALVTLSACLRDGTRKVVFDSGCKNSQYCRVTRFPRTDECEVSLKCDTGKPKVYPVCSKA